MRTDPFDTVTIEREARRMQAAVLRGLFRRAFAAIRRRRPEPAAA